MEGEPRMVIEPFADLRVLMGRIVVEDDMDSLFGWDVSLDLVEEADELLMPMLLHAAPERRDILMRKSVQIKNIDISALDSLEQTDFLCENTTIDWQKAAPSWADIFIAIVLPVRAFSR